jgi:uncharacterized membrane-anchored protein YitT (DUF2179 family)
VWFTNIVLNIPLFFVAAKSSTKQQTMNLLWGNLGLTGFLAVLPVFPILTGDMVVDLVSGSVLMGAGLGMVFLADASSGGADLLAVLIQKKLRYLSVPKILAGIDFIIVVAGGTVFGVKNIIYALIAIFIITRVSEYMTAGPGRALLVQIISDKNPEVADYIMQELNRGVSSISICGMYTKQEKTMLICAVSVKEIAKIKEFLYKIDKKAVCFVGEIKEAFGEGFTNYRP